MKHKLGLRSQPFTHELLLKLTDGGAVVVGPAANLPVKQMASRMGMCIDHGCGAHLVFAACTGSALYIHKREPARRCWS